MVWVLLVGELEVILVVGVLTKSNSEGIHAGIIPIEFSLNELRL